MAFNRPWRFGVRMLGAPGLHCSGPHQLSCLPCLALGHSRAQLPSRSAVCCSSAPLNFAPRLILPSAAPLGQPVLRSATPALSGPNTRHSLAVNRSGARCRSVVASDRPGPRPFRFSTGLGLSGTWPPWLLQSVVIPALAVAVVPVSASTLPPDHDHCPRPLRFSPALVFSPVPCSTTSGQSGTRPLKHSSISGFGARLLLHVAKVALGLSNPRPLQCSVSLALDMSSGGLLLPLQCLVCQALGSLQCSDS